LAVRIVNDKKELYGNLESRTIALTYSDIMNSLGREKRGKMTFYKGPERPRQDW